MQLLNVTKAPGWTAAGVAGGLGINLAPIPPTGNEHVDLALRVAQILASLFVLVWGALKGPKG